MDIVPPKDMNHVIEILRISNLTVYKSFLVCEKHTYKKFCMEIDTLIIKVKPIMNLPRFFYFALVKAIKCIYAGHSRSSSNGELCSTRQCET